MKLLFEEGVDPVLEQRVRDTFKQVKQHKRHNDLLVSVKQTNTLSRGLYKNIWIHGLPVEVTRRKKFRRITSLITLKIQVGTSDGDLIELIAHEYKHYLDLRTWTDSSKYRHWEVRAGAFAYKKRKELVQPKAYGEVKTE